MAIKAKDLVIERLERGTCALYFIGKSPLVMNRMTKKAKETLLLPAPSKNKAARAQSLKHDPIAEFRDSIYRCRDDKAPTLCHMPNGAFKKALAQAAIDIPGATKAEIGRLVKVVDPTVHIYGVPYLYMDVVRMAGVAKTPDIRTRAKFPEWAFKLTLQYIRTKIREQDIVNLADAAGDIIGIGDGRTERGSFSNGEFELVSDSDERFLKIIRTQARKAQQAAMNEPVCADSDSEELLAWYNAEIIRREKDRGERVRIPKTTMPPVGNGKKRARRTEIRP
jgi:hypothetical protein